MPGRANTAVAGQSPKTWSPLAAQTANKRGKWRPLSVAGDQIIVKGGFNTKNDVAKMIQYQMNTTQHNFVELDKNALWFLHGVGGMKAQKGDLKSVTVMTLIRQKLNTVCGGDVQDTAVVDADDTQNGDAADDPMNQLEDVTPTPQTTATCKPKSRSKVPKQSKVWELQMPKRPECTGTDQSETLKIYVYRQQGKKKLWQDLSAVG
jgi:hypothetical protein